MLRASASQRTQRLNRSRTLLQECSSLSQAVQRLAQACSISARQAYRYLKQAQGLSHRLHRQVAPTQVRQLRLYAARTRLTLSEIVSRALTAMLDRGRRRG